MTKFITKNVGTTLLFMTLFLAPLVNTKKVSFRETKTFHEYDKDEAISPKTTPKRTSPLSQRQVLPASYLTPQKRHQRVQRTTQPRPSLHTSHTRKSPVDLNKLQTFHGDFTPPKASRASGRSSSRGPLS